MIDCNEWRTEKRHECANMGKVKRLELWWQLYRTSLPVWDLENFRPMDFCWHECKSTIPNSVTTYKKRTKNQIFGIKETWGKVKITFQVKSYVYRYTTDTEVRYTCSRYFDITLQITGYLHTSLLSATSPEHSTLHRQLKKIKTPYVLFQKNFNFSNSPKRRGFSADGLFIAKVA